MNIQTIEINHFKALGWTGEIPTDWNSSKVLFGTQDETNNVHFGFAFDSSIISACGTYALVYVKLGTKGLLIKNGKILREINRSYYRSDVYEFPAAFFTLNNTVYLAHCPEKYCRIEFEELESGRIITRNESRVPTDFFHSRFEISPDNRFLLSKGWFWHPFDTIQLFDIEACVSNPHLLDRGDSIDVTVELCSASFIDNDKIVVCASKEEPMNDEDPESILPGQLAIWDFKNDEVNLAVDVAVPIGNVFTIDTRYCWDLFDYPKIIDLSTGEILDKAENILSGKQNSSIIHHLKELPKMAYNKNTKQLAISAGEKIQILTAEIRL